MEVRRTGQKTWLFTGVSEGEVREATERAFAERAPIDAGPLPGIVKAGLKAVVALTTYDAYDRPGGRFSKTHLMGPAMYQTTATVRTVAGGVEVQRHTQGMLGPAADLTDLGAAIRSRMRR